jgi:hypothetical protein
VRGLSRWRQAIEEGSQFLKRQVSLGACQAGDTRSSPGAHQQREGVQAPHRALGGTAYVMVERERRAQGVTLRQRRRTLLIKGRRGSWPSLKRFRRAA